MLDGLDNILIGNNSPVPQIGSGATREIQLRNDLYIFSLGNIFSTSVIRTETLKIEPLATGIFFVDVRPEVTRVYASTTPLKISIINKDQTLTDIRLFPL